MSGLKDKLLELVEEFEGSWSAEEIALAKAIADDYARLTVARVEGIDVGAELRHVEAQAVALAAAGTVTLGNVLEEGVRRFLGDLASDIIPGL